MSFQTKLGRVSSPKVESASVLVITRRPVELPSIIVAIVLAALTLGVFAAEQYSGPVSVVRRFQDAAKTNPEGISGLVTNPFSDSNVLALINVVRYVEAQHGRWTFDQTLLKGNVAFVQTTISWPQGRPETIIWVVVRTGNRWRIDAYQTRRGLILGM